MNSMHETRSPEVQAIFGKLPGKLVSWGMTFILIVITGVLAGAASIKYPETASYPVTVSPGSALMLVPDSKIGNISAGQNVNLKLEGTGNPGIIPAKVKFIAPYNEKDKACTVELEIQDAAFIVNREMQGYGEIVINEMSVLKRLFKNFIPDGK
jgi:hypothetical protein